MIYENGHLSRILTDVGYITLNGTTPMYHYYLKDHLGNNRVVMNERGAVEQVNHYYAFGGLMGESTGGGVQPYKLECSKSVYTSDAKSERIQLIKLLIFNTLYRKISF